MALLVAVAAGGAIVSCRDWQGEVLLAQGMAPDVRNKEAAAAAAPYLKRGASRIMDPAWWYNAKFRYAVCLRRQGRLDEPIRVLREIDREVPNLGATRLYLAEVHFARSDLVGALSNVNSYLSANADPGGYLLGAKVLLAGKPRQETVIHYLEKCLAFGPSESQRAEAERLLKEVREAGKRPE